MITINVKKDQIIINGHANFAEYGKDIVCAAVSSIVTTTVNAILRIDSEAITYSESSNLEIIIKKHTETIDILITNMIELLEELQMQYGKNIKIKY